MITSTNLDCKVGEHTLNIISKPIPKPIIQPNHLPTYTASPMARIPIFSRVFPPPLHIHARQYRDSQPYHHHKEEKRVADISRHVSNQPDDQWSEEGAGL